MNPCEKWNEDVHLPTWDASMCAAETSGLEAKRLMAKAYESALPVTQQQHLLAMLNSDPKVVYQIGLTPAKVTRVLDIL
jgi:hypothetical protein